MSGIVYGLLWVLARGVAWLCFRYRVEGQVPHTGGVLVAANHASYLDIPLLGCGMNRRAWYLGRHDLFPVPGLNSLFQSLGWIPVKLGRLDREAFGKAVSLIQAGHVVVIFPEGGRTQDGHLRQPKAGIGVIVSQTGCPVVPAYLKGTFDVLPPGASWPRWSPVTVRIGAPITFDAGKQKERAETKQFYQHVSRTVIEHIAALGQVSVPTRKDDVANDTPSRSTADAHNAE
ncbi:MAG: 1-acyl-sn-glycerol-3-phosphate acyltransferase [Nitrospira sp.]|nr:1-acyl-sn-glycerol-3-phosphate acyltransferase [Nitrospira sp.]MDH4303013.1 1-acyl-sn-glycerol-3-phosphate acyltransferase [Nitrospira sp.]MDH5192797.1 1-acyl-sn-glycerol-3-phosphate acyltransferase [Nitrospira sp.]